jgi:hypothetical protein
MSKQLSISIQESPISYSYAAFKVTQSRIDKGLLAIPKSLAGWFPGNNEQIQVYLNDSISLQTKHFSSYNSSTRECRIGGMRNWFERNGIKDGDEIAIQLLDSERRIYRLIPERKFIEKTKDLQIKLDKSKSEQEANQLITNISKWTGVELSAAVINEFYRLAHSMPYEDRRYTRRVVGRSRENAPANIRTILLRLYQGHCQVCDFSFFNKDNKPYFEIHHLNPVLGNHPKNLLAVCGNCHNQFEFAHVREWFSGDRWLIRVSFNKQVHTVKQAIFDMKMDLYRKELFN